MNLRKGAKLSQEQLAEKMGVTRQTISNWELDEFSPDLFRLNTQILNLQYYNIINRKCYSNLQ